MNVLFLGDTSFGENYQDRLISSGRQSILRSRGYAYMLEAFQGLCAASDFTVANLETPITDRFPSPHVGSKKYLHYADVENVPRYLDALGVQLVSLANNHTLDFGAKGLEQTLELLERHNIEACGAGPTIDAARQPCVRRLDVGGRSLHLAILCMFEYRKSYDEDYQWYAGVDRPGVNPLSMKQVRASVGKLKAEYESVVTIAFPHWGKNYAWATDRQRRLARGMVDAGVDLVIGHGAHMLQEVERYQDCWIVYSLGNFVFGSPGRYARREAPPFGLIARLRLSAEESRKRLTLRLYPILTDNRVTNYQSRFVTEPEFGAVRTLLAEHGPQDSDAATIPTGRDKHGLYLELA